MLTKHDVMQSVAGVVLILGGLAGTPGVRADPAPPVSPDAPVPTAEQIVADLNRITDPTVRWQDKADVVEPGFAPDEGSRIDTELNRLNTQGFIPFAFIVTDIKSAPNDYAGATVAIPQRPRTPPCPIVLVRQGDRWQITHDTAMAMLTAIWNNASSYEFPYATMPWMW